MIIASGPIGPQVENVVRMRFRCGLTILERILKRFPGYATDDVQLWTTLRSWWRRIGEHAWSKWRANRRLWKLPYRALQTLGEWLRKDYDKKVLPRLADDERRRIEALEHAQRALAARQEQEAVESARIKQQADLFDLEAAKARLEKPRPVAETVTVYPHGAVGLAGPPARDIPIHPSVRESSYLARLARWARGDVEGHCMTPAEASAEIARRCRGAA